VPGSSPLTAILERAAVGPPDERTLVARDGRQRPIEGSVAPIRLSDGTVAGVVLVFRDVSARREGQALFRVVADSAPVMIWMARPDGRRTWFNRPWLAFTGRGMASELDDGWADGVHGDDRGACLEDYRRAVTARQPFALEYRLRRADGQYRWVLDQGVPRIEADGTFVGHVGSAIDVSALRDIAEERARLLAAAEAANRAKDEFLATLSHELRTPLNAIVGWAEVLGRVHEQPATVAREVDAMLRNARLQARLIDDLLDLSRISAGQMHLERRPLDLEPVVTAALDTVRPAAEAQAITLDWTPEPVLGAIMGDPDRLQQVFWNLLANAIKFTSPNGRVAVRLTRVGSEAQVTIQDTGQGIPPEVLPFVFEPFRQADSSHARQRGGLGLGLAIVRRVVEMHGGWVVAASPGPGRGATFTVRLPLMSVQVPPPRGHSPSPGAPGCPGVRVLLVDDEPDARELLAAVLEHHGAVVRAAATVPEALRALDEAVPDVLVSDLAMPVLDGFELIRRVRARAPKRAGRLPAIALSAHADARSRRRALEEGFDAYLTKPAEGSELAGAIAGLVRGPAGTAHQ
jgi:PAS domain S-box-containing protein